MLTNQALLGSINGVYEEQLFYQNATKATGAADLAFNVNLLDNVTKAGKSVVAIEYVSSASAVSSIENSGRGGRLRLLHRQSQPEPRRRRHPGPPRERARAAEAAAAEEPAGRRRRCRSPPPAGRRPRPRKPISGKVDVADAGSSVRSSTGRRRSRTAVVDATGAWSAMVTLDQPGRQHHHRDGRQRLRDRKVERDHLHPHDASRRADRRHHQRRRDRDRRRARRSPARSISPTPARR